MPHRKLVLMVVYLSVRMYVLLCTTNGVKISKCMNIYGIRNVKKYTVMCMPNCGYASL